MPNFFAPLYYLLVDFGAFIGTPIVWLLFSRTVDQSGFDATTVILLVFFTLFGVGASIPLWRWFGRLVRIRTTWPLFVLTVVVICLSVVSINVVIDPAVYRPATGISVAGRLTMAALPLLIGAALIVIAFLLIGLGAFYPFLFSVGLWLLQIRMSRLVRLLSVLFSCVAATALFLAAWDSLSSGIRGSEYFPLNAAIKNTCFLDPERRHCPRSLAELSYIEPRRFQAAKSTTTMYYHYFADTNDYMFLVQYRRNRVAIFDSRLLKRTGLDYREAMLSTTSSLRIFTGPKNDPLDDLRPQWEALLRGKVVKPL